MKSPSVRAVVSYEPGSGFVFPEGEVPRRCRASPVRSKVSALLAPSLNPGQDNWRVRLAMVRIWRDTVNRHGGDVTLVRLPDIGIHGNTHFPFSDTSNVEIANLLSRFLAEKQLDGVRR